jgi:hypothetical protein
MDSNSPELPDFWKGILLGTMIGMVITTYALAFTDNSIKTSGQPRPLNHQELDQKAAA